MHRHAAAALAHLQPPPFGKQQASSAASSFISFIFHWLYRYQIIHILYSLSIFVSFFTRQLVSLSTIPSTYRYVPFTRSSACWRYIFGIQTRSNLPVSSLPTTNIIISPFFRAILAAAVKSDIQTSHSVPYALEGKQVQAALSPFCFVHRQSGVGRGKADCLLSFSARMAALSFTTVIAGLDTRSKSNST